MQTEKPNWMTVSEALRWRAAKTPDHVALIQSEKRLNWQDIDRCSDRIAWYFYQEGIRKGQRVGLWGFNSVHWILTFLGLQKLGVQAVLFNPYLVETELKELIEYIKPAAICALDAPKQLPSLYGTKPYRLYTMTDINRHMQIPTTPDERHHLETVKREVGPEDLLGILFTSGTTSRSKGVMLRQGDVISVAFETARQMHWGESDISSMALPLFHCFGLSAGYLSSLASGHCVCLVDGVHSTSILKTVSRYQCTILNGVPTMFLAILKKNLLQIFDVSSLKSGIIAGSPVSKEDYLEICQAFQFEFLAMSYGQTETSPSITFSPYGDPPEKIAESVGRVIDSLECRIVSLQGKKSQPVEAVGEIEVRGYHVFAGYYQMEKETEAAIEPDGWLHTGDLGFLDDEGYLHVTGRKKDMIIRCGENISCMEIEQAILQYPNVKEVKVIGIPSVVTQEEVGACIVPEDGKQLDKQKLRTFLSALLTRYKIPRYILFLDELPRTANGKIKSGALKDVLLKQIEGGKS